MNRPLRLRLFGGFQLEDANGTAISLPLRKAQALLAFLAVTKGQCALRDRLASLFWGDSEAHLARQSLRQVLVTLGKALDDSRAPVLRMDGQEVALLPGQVTVDAVELEWLLAEGSDSSLTEAQALYHGEFLDGLTVDAPDFEDWLQETRSRLRDQMLQGLIELFELHVRTDKVGAAVAAGNQALRLDPMHEDMHRRLMQLYADRGMRSSALAQYRQCRDSLARDLGIGPDRQTERLLKEILDQRQRRSQGADDGQGGGARDRVTLLPGHWSPLDRPAHLTAGRNRPAAGATDAIEQMRAQILKGHYEVMARQLVDSGQSRAALDAVLQGARLETKRGAAPAAQAILDQAQAIFSGEAMAPEAGEALAELHLAQATLAEQGQDHETLTRSLQQAETLAQRDGNNRVLVRVLLARSRLHAREGRRQEALATIRHGFAASDGMIGQDAWLPGERWLTQLHLTVGRHESVMAGLERRIAHCKAVGLTADEAESRALLAIVQGSQQALAQAVPEADRAVALALRAATPAIQIACLQAQGLTRFWSGQSEAALASFQKAIELAHGEGDLLRVYVLRGLRGAALLAEGQHGEAWAQLSQVIELASELGSRFMLAFFKAWRAEAACAQGREEKVKLCEAALAFAREANQPWAASIACRALARAQSDPRSLDTAAAARAADWAVATQRGLNLRFELARSLALQARIEELRGAPDQARPPAKEARRLARQLGGSASSMLAGSDPLPKVPA